MVPHIPVSLSYLSFDLFVVIVDDLGETKVSQLYDLFAVHEEDIVWLDVAMYDPFLFVQVVDPHAQLALYKVYARNRKGQGWLGQKIRALHAVRVNYLKENAASWCLVFKPSI